MSPAKNTTESLIVDGVPYSIKYRDADGNPLLNGKGKPRQRKPGGGRKRNLRKLPERPHTHIHTPDAALYATSEAGERGKRDLWFLASKILNRVYPDLVESLHKPMCEFFIQKNPAKIWLLQDTAKNRLLLAPRGHFKTTINLCDTIQWMLAFPDVTIVLFSGTQELTARMVDEIKQHFLMNGDFREMFPGCGPYGLEG